MKWIVSHNSALEFWRGANAKDALAGKKLRAFKPHTKSLCTKELQSEIFWNFDIPVHVLVGSDNARKVNKNMICHISSGEYPDGSFVRMDSGLIVSSPELCFMQMAEKVSFVKLVALGYELCGSYRLDKESVDGQGFRSDMPRSTISELRSYIDKAAGLKGRENAMKALRYIIDGSASPMETILTMLLTLPYRLGGYGFPMPLLNHRVDVPVSARKSTGRLKYFCDIYWPEKKVDVEYDSDAHHTGSDRIAKDAIRRNVLTSLGITVVTVSRLQVIDNNKRRELAHILSKLLGKRLQCRKEEFARLNAKLMEQLLAKLPIN